jgi:hypothetical protein
MFSLVTNQPMGENFAKSFVHPHLEDLSFACHANGSAVCSGLFSGMSDDGSSRSDSGSVP